MDKRSLSFWEAAAGLPTVVTEPEKVPPRSDVLIVGAGFCGAWLAYFLKKRHPHLGITVVERDVLSLGASTRNAGFLSCGNVSEWLDDFRALGWEETIATFAARVEGIRIVLAEWGGVSQSDPCGSVDFDPITDEKIDLMNRLNAWWAQGETHPIFSIREVDLGGNRVTGIENRFDRGIDPVHLLSALHHQLKRLGVTLCHQVSVEAMGKGEARLRIADEERTVRYGYGYVCTNGFNRRLAPSSPILPARGQIIVTSPVETRTHRCLGFLRSGYDYYRFIGDRLLVGGGRLGFQKNESTDELQTSEELRRYLLELAREIVGHDRFSVEFHWAGIMGLHGGGHASISQFRKPSPMDERTEELSACGSWGVTLSPVVARARAESYPFTAC